MPLVDALFKRYMLWVVYWAWNKCINMWSLCPAPKSNKTATVCSWKEVSVKKWVPWFTEINVREQWRTRLIGWALVYLEEMRASAHCAKNTTAAETRGLANLGNPCYMSRMLPIQMFLSLYINTILLF